MEHIQYLIALNFEQDGSIPEWWPLIPAGRFTGRDGRSWINDRPEEAIKNILALNRDVPLDEEHSTELKAPNGDAAPARGFFTEYEVREGQIFGKVDLNQIGQDKISNKEYRYYSPALLYDPKTGRVTGISSVGLTNKHNIYEIPALNQQLKPEDTTVEFKAIATALGLNTDATESQIIAGINELKTQYQTALNQEQTPDATKFVPMETHKLALNRAKEAEDKLKVNQQEALKGEALEVVEQAIKDKKIAPANKDHYLGLCHDESGLNSVKELLKSAPTVIADDVVDGDDPSKQTTALNSEEKQVAALLGLDEKDMSDAKAEA